MRVRISRSVAIVLTTACKMKAVVFVLGLLALVALAAGEEKMAREGTYYEMTGMGNSNRVYDIREGYVDPDAQIISRQQSHISELQPPPITDGSPNVLPDTVAETLEGLSRITYNIVKGDDESIPVFHVLRTRRLPGYHLIPPSRADYGHPPYDYTSKDQEDAEAVEEQVIVAGAGNRADESASARPGDGLANDLSKPQAFINAAFVGSGQSSYLMGAGRDNGITVTYVPRRTCKWTGAEAPLAKLDQEVLCTRTKAPYPDMLDCNGDTLNFCYHEEAHLDQARLVCNSRNLRSHYDECMRLLLPSWRGGTYGSMIMTGTGNDMFDTKFTTLMAGKDERIAGPLYDYTTITTHVQVRGSFETSSIKFLDVDHDQVCNGDYHVRMGDHILFVDKAVTVNLGGRDRIPDGMRLIVRPTMLQGEDVYREYEELPFSALSCLEADCDIFLFDMAISGNSVACAPQLILLSDMEPIELVYSEKRNAWYEL